MAKSIEHVHWPDAPNLRIPYAPAIKVQGGTTVLLGWGHSRSGLASPSTSVGRDRDPSIRHRQPTGDGGSVGVVSSARYSSRVGWAGQEGANPVHLGRSG